MKYDTVPDTPFTAIFGSVKGDDISYADIPSAAESDLCRNHTVQKNPLSQRAELFDQSRYPLNFAGRQLIPRLPASMYHNNQLHTTTGLVSGFLCSASPEISIEDPQCSMHADLLHRLLRCCPPNRPFNLLNSTTSSQGVWIHLDMTAMEFSSSAPNHAPLASHPLSYLHLNSSIPSQTRGSDTYIARDISLCAHLPSRPANSFLRQIISTSSRQAPFHNDQTPSHPPNTLLTNKRLKALRKSAMYRWSGIGWKRGDEVIRAEGTAVPAFTVSRRTRTQLMSIYIHKTYNSTSSQNIEPLLHPNRKGCASNPTISAHRSGTTASTCKPSRRQFPLQPYYESILASDLSLQNPRHCI